MTQGLTSGWHIAWFCALGILIVQIFPIRRQDARVRLILYALIALLAAESFFIGSLIYLDYPVYVDSAQFIAIRTASAVLTAAAGVLMGLSIWKWKPRQQRLPLFLTVLFPLWLAVGYWRAAYGSVAAFGAIPGAMSLSLLLEIGFYHQSKEVELRNYAMEVERRQMLVLQEQMRPHFIFNAMDSIRDLCETDPAAAADGMGSLSDYLRQNIDALSSDKPIPFTREMEHIQAYVALEKLRAPGEFEVVFDLQEIDFTLPALSIQPLVENAILHGVRELDRNGLVIVSTERQGDYIRVIVEDNGHGFPKGISNRQKERLSHGLENVRTRLNTQCGGSLHINSKESGARMVVLLPQKRRGS